MSRPAKDLANRSISERYDHLFTLITSQRFLNMEGLGNEVPFFICPFNPKEAVEMQRLAAQLANRLRQAGIQVLEINLYDLSITLLKNRGIWERVLALEETVSKDEFRELLQGVLDPEAHLVPAIAEQMAQRPFDVMFITGVGEVFPYIRSHNVLNNLQSTAKAQPTVMFFPGNIPIAWNPGLRWICLACFMTTNIIVPSTFTMLKPNDLSNGFGQVANAGWHRAKEKRTITQSAQPGYVDLKDNFSCCVN